MKLSITYIDLKSPLLFFRLSKEAWQIIKQLKTTNCKQYKSTGIWTKHYTITLWNNEQEMIEFARSGAHLESMKNSKNIAKEIRVLTIDSDKIIDWKSAKELVHSNKAKSIKF